MQYKYTDYLTEHWGNHTINTYLKCRESIDSHYLFMCKSLHALPQLEYIQ